MVPSIPTEASKCQQRQSTLLVIFSFVDLPSNTALGGLENISPIFRAYPGSVWRGHIEVMWRYLREVFHVEANDSCGTHVHHSIAEGYTLQNLKQVAQTIIHFEPALEALLPESRRGNEYSRSSWIDNRNFGYKNLNRRQSMKLIDDCSNISELVVLMNPDHDKMFECNFLYLLNNRNGTIEFRRGAASTNVIDVFVWVEFAMSFVQAAHSQWVAFPPPEDPQYRRWPADIYPRRWFLGTGPWQE